MTVPTSSRDWEHYFLFNAEHQRPIPWEEGADLSPAEARAVIRSLQAWQLGETSEGVNLTAATRLYAARIGDPDLPAAMALFIAEEQRHGELLGRFLDLHGTPRLRRNWGDTVFRWCRSRLLSLEVWTTVVIVVETLALIYYRAVMHATGSRVLQTICRQILHDEIPHLRFQYERLAILYQHRGPVARWLTLMIQHGLFTATTLAVWIGHHRALRAGGYPWLIYWRAACKRMTFHWQRAGLIPSRNNVRHERTVGSHLQPAVIQAASIDVEDDLDMVQPETCRQSFHR